MHRHVRQQVQTDVGHLEQRTPRKPGQRVVVGRIQRVRGDGGGAEVLKYIRQQVHVRLQVKIVTITQSDTIKPVPDSLRVTVLVIGDVCLGQRRVELLRGGRLSSSKQLNESMYSYGYTPFRSRRSVFSGSSPCRSRMRTNASRGVAFASLSSEVLRKAYESMNTNCRHIIAMYFSALDETMLMEPRCSVCSLSTASWYVTSSIFV